MSRRYLTPASEAHITQALRHIYFRAVREGLDDARAHADALLRLYGVDSADLRVPAKRPHHYKRGKLRLAIMDALRDGPMEVAALSAKVGNGQPPKVAYKSTGRTLTDMKAAGLVTHEGRLWGLAGLR